MKIKILICLWKRPEITKICFEGIKRLRKRFDVDPVCIFSEDVSRSLCTKYKFESYYHENLPLGRKFNFGITKALESEWDYLMTLGSDNLITDSLLELYKAYEGKDAFGINTAYLFDSETGKSGVFKNGYTLGAGRMLRREVCESKVERYRVRYKQSVSGEFTIGKGGIRDLLKDDAERCAKMGYVEIIGEANKTLIYPDNKSKTLDFASDFNISCKGYRVETIKTDEVYILDIKSKENIWPFSWYELTEIDVLKYFPEHEQIRGLVQLHNPAKGN